MPVIFFMSLITALYLASAALLLLSAQAFLPFAGLVRDAAILAVSGVILFRLISVETSRRDGIERALRVQATHDPLTGLANRAYFEDNLQRATARAALEFAAAGAFPQGGADHSATARAACHAA